MKFQHRVEVPASRQWTWDLVTDIPRVAGCMPWIQNLQRLDNNKYQADIKVKVGPISLSLGSQLLVEELNVDGGEGSFKVNGSDKKGAGQVLVKMRLLLEPNGSDSTSLIIDTDATITGKLGQFGQPILRHKADAMMKEFVQNLSRVGGGTQTS